MGAVISTTSLLQKFESVGVHLLLEEGRFVVDAPVNILTPELKEAIRFHKSDLIDLLRVKEATQQALELFPGSRIVREPSIEEDIPWDQNAVPFSGHGQRICGFANHVDRVWFRDDGKPTCQICHPPHGGRNFDLRRH